jgi:hypothetical protein
VPIYRSVGTACAGDLDGLIAVPRRQGPWVMPSQPAAATRRLAVPRLNAGRSAATSSPPPHRLTLRPLALLSWDPAR